MSKTPLPQADRLHLDAARGWLDLGNLLEAEMEMRALSTAAAAHPEALAVHARLAARQGQWEMVLDYGRSLSDLEPEDAGGWLFQGRALLELNRNVEAFELLLRAKETFTNSEHLFYELARAAARTGHFYQGRNFLTAALILSGKETFERDALRDPDLKTLWPRNRKPTIF